MKREFVYLEEFDRNWYKLGLTDNDLMALEIEIMNNPNIGKLISHTGGLRKMRFVLPSNNKGKSGGVRVLYVDFVSYEQTVLMNVYQKGEKETLTDKEKQEYRQYIEKMLRGLRK